MQRLGAFPAIMSASRRLTVDGDELGSIRPYRRDPALETASEQQGIDPVEENTQPAGTRNAMVEGGKTHTPATLYHRAKSGRRATELPGVADLLRDAGVSEGPAAQVGVFVGNAWDPRPGRETPWLDLAWQLAGDKANPGRINYASGGVGTGQHLCGELFKMMTGIDMVHVPYRGSAPAISDLIAGQVQVMFDYLPSSIEYIRAGTLRALAVTTAKRWPALPDLPTVNDFLPGFEVITVIGIAAPKKTPNEVIGRLNYEINAALADPRSKATIAELGGEPLTSSPGSFANLLAADADKWSKVIRAANIKMG